ncbi:MAG: hypothetical protein LJE96_09955 [Deltaproteobacteria bacterium]|nr:hypothetical protein [Deltaproteobacteria bacterium]
MTKTEFLGNLETAMKKIICEMFNEDAIPEKRIQLERQVGEFVRDNASEYSLEELMETFTSAQAAIGLFLEYQDAKRICGESESP